MTQDFPPITQETFGQLPDGRTVTQFTLRNGQGMEVRLINFGGIITHLFVPDREGQVADVVLGFDDLAPYLTDSPYFGALIGRFGNRIANAEFSLDGETVALDKNDGDNHLHGGFEGFDKKLWEAQVQTDSRGPALALSLTSPDGDQGYPGNLDVKVVYVLTGDNELITEYEARTDRATPVNLTQHSYFNLAGEGDVLNHRLQLNAREYTPVKEGLIPTGERAPVSGTPLDFTELKRIEDPLEPSHPQLALANGGYDHNFVVDRNGEGLALAARAVEPNSGRMLEVFTEEPGFQFYSGNFLDGSLKGKGRVFPRHGAFCIEPQHFPDAPNQASFPSTILRPGEVYRTRMSFRFGVAG